MTYLGMTLEAAPRFFGWGELFNWTRHLPPESATVRWAVRRERDRKNGKRSFGKGGGIAISEFDKWYYGGE